MYFKTDTVVVVVVVVYNVYVKCFIGGAHHLYTHANPDLLLKKERK
jgi:hypothetical protein